MVISRALGTRLLFVSILCLISNLVYAASNKIEEDIVILAGEDKTIYEYRTGGILTMIKVVPKKGRPYYLVPADNSPHFTDLANRDKLYPSWTLLEW